MNKYTVALCYPPQTDNTLLELIRAKTTSFGLRAEYFFNDLTEVNSMGIRLLRLSRGHDLVVVLCDNTSPLSEYDFFGHFNHTVSDPWATCVLAVGSREWKHPQPTLAVEPQVYLGHLYPDQLPANFLELLLKHREELYDRGLNDKQWKSILSYASSEECQAIKLLRSRIV